MGLRCLQNRSINVSAAKPNTLLLPVSATHKLLSLSKQNDCTVLLKRLEVTPVELDNLKGIAIDKNGNLWVADSQNNRVLGYSNPKSIMPTANYVIGQPNFTTANYAVTQNEFSTAGSITQIAFDNNNNLWVYDYYRILGFASSSLYGNNQPNASWLMFQDNYTLICGNYLYPKSTYRYLNRKLNIKDHHNLFDTD